MGQSRMLALVVSVALLAVTAAGCADASIETEPTSIEMGTYENTEHGFSLQYPEGWTENMQGAGTQFSIDFTDPEGRLTTSVYLQYECQELILADYVAECKGYLESSPQYQLISERAIVVGEGASGHEVVARGDFGAGKVEKSRFLLVARGQQGFWVFVRGEPTDFDEQEQIVDAVADSFKLLPTYSFAAPEPWPGGTYTGSGFTIDFPEGWCQYPPLRPEHILHFAAPERTPSVHISMQPGPEDATLDDYVDSALESFPDHWASFSLMSRGKVTLGGTPAYEIVFTGISNLSPGYTNRCKYLIVPRGTQGFFWVMAPSSPALFQQHEPVINEVIYSFRLH